MKRINAIACAVLLSAIVAADSASAQVTLTGTGYTQTFDGIGLGLPPGWSVRTNSSATGLGTEVALTTNNTSWGSSSGQFANYASTVNHGTNFLGSESTTIQSACTNRCPGLRQTGPFGDPGAAIVCQLQNTLGLAGFKLTIDLNMLSAQQNRSNFWIIDYGIGSNPGSFVSVWTNADPGVFGATTKTIDFGNALDNESQNVWIRIVALDASTGSGTRDTFGIDNFKLNYESSGTVSPIPLNMQLIGTNAVLTWSNAAFALQAAPLINGDYTNIPGAISPYTNSIDGAQKYFRLRAN